MVSQIVSCPLISLKVAVNLVQKIYKTEKAHPTTRLGIAKAMNYGSLSGASYSRIADLIGYGLLEVSNKEQLNLTTDALGIILYPKGDDKRKKAVLKTAFAPPMFHELHTVYDTRLPDNAELESNLTDMGLHQNKVSHAIRAYRGTIEFVIEEVNLSTQELSDKQVIRETNYIETFTNNKNISNQNDSILPSQINQGEEGALTWKIEDDSIQAGYKGYITQKALQRLVKYAQVSIDDYPEGENEEDEELIMKKGRNYILLSYTGHVTQKTLQRFMEHLQVYIGDFPGMQKAVSEKI